MKKSIITSTFIFLNITLYSQITFFQEKKDTVIDIKKEIVIPYDSLNSIEIEKDKELFYQNKKYIGQKIFLTKNTKMYSLNIQKFKLSDSKFAKFIKYDSDSYLKKYPTAETWTCVYKPTEDLCEYGGYRRYIDFKTNDSVNNRYYTISNFYNPESNTSKFKTVNNIFKNQSRRDSIITDYQDFINNIELVDDLNGDTVYVDNISNFISVGWFLKLKSKLENHTYIFYQEDDSYNNCIQDVITEKKYLKDSLMGKTFECRVNLYKDKPLISFENKDAKVSFINCAENLNDEHLYYEFKKAPRFLKKCITIDSLQYQIYSRDQSISKFEPNIKSTYEYTNDLKCFSYHDFIQLTDISSLNHKLDSVISAKKTVLSKHDIYLSDLNKEKESKLSLARIASEKDRLKSIEEQIERKKQLISRFGQKFGTLLAKSEIEIGMSKEMVKEGWCNYYQVIQKTNTTKGLIEIWDNNILGKRVYLLNNVVCNIQILK